MGQGAEEGEGGEGAWPRGGAPRSLCWPDNTPTLTRARARSVNAMPTTITHVPTHPPANPPRPPTHPLAQGNLSEFVKVKPEAKSYYELAATSVKFKFPDPGAR